MPTPQDPIRTWCKTCQDWTIFNPAWINTPSKCRVCDTEFSEYQLSEIPEEQIKEQRTRYREQNKFNKQRLMNSVMSGIYGGFGKFGGGGVMDTFFNEVQAISNTIQEDDAGIKEMVRLRKIEEDRLDTIKAEERTQLKLKYAPYIDLKRNDKCLCGSGKKYKHCKCYTEYASLRNFVK